jgi:capsid protein
MGFYKRPAVEHGPVGTPNADGTAVADGEDDEGNLITEAEPGTFGVLPAGWDFTTYDPAYPNDAMAGFIKGMLRAFSSGVGLTYNTIGNDLEGVSLSSLRHGANQDRDTYEAIQQWFVDHVCVPMYEPALQMALTFGRVGSLPPDAFERLNKPRFIPRPFRSPDPQKDVAAGAQQVALATNSRTRLCAENGLDFEEVLQELADEEAMARAMKVTLGVAVPTSGKNPPADTAAPKPAAPGADDDTETDPEEEPTDDPA